ncbi:site-2 protease family protein [soil metagenome]
MYNGYLMDLSVNATSLVIIFVSLIVSISIHEMMHAYVGYKLGDTTAYEHGRISLNPLRHIDPFLTILLPAITLILFHAPILAAKPVPFDPRQVRYDEFGAAMIAAAGPLTNLVLAILSAALLTLTAASGILGDILTIFTVLNVGLFVFNMIPIPPLDGSRVLYAVAPQSVQNVMAQLEQFGFFIIFGLVLFVPGFTTLLYNINQSILQILP